MVDIILMKRKGFDMTEETHIPLALEIVQGEEGDTTGILYLYTKLNEVKSQGIDLNDFLINLQDFVLQHICKTCHSLKSDCNCTSEVQDLGHLNLSILAKTNGDLYWDDGETLTPFTTIKLKQLGPWHKMLSILEDEVKKITR